MLRLHPLYHSRTKILQKKLPLCSSFLVSMAAMPFNCNSLFSSTKPFLPSFSTFTCFNTRFRTPTNTVISCTHSTNSHPLSLRTSPLSYAAHSTIPPPVSLEGSNHQTERLRKLMMKLTELGIKGYNPMPGQHNSLLCPMCSGGDSGEKSLALQISADGNNAVWICFRGKCGWQGNTMAIGGVLPTSGKPKQIIKVTKRVLAKDSLSLEPLCNELLAYFAERMITASTLRRNHVMQQKNGNKVAVAFTYMRDGALVGCKYRDENKKFWQEEDTEKIFYGLDDIRNATDIIIVEGEVDKLSLEEAGFLNCVSVPDGAPPKVSGKDLPSPDQDTKYQYLWNCKEYFEKASRIILATDGDQPGQALAEELARRLGRERCWRVKWPKKNDVDYFKDANEVMILWLLNLDPCQLVESWIDKL